MAEKGAKKQVAVKKTTKSKRPSKTAGKSSKSGKKRQKVISAGGDAVLLEAIPNADIELAPEHEDGLSPRPPLEEKYFAGNDGHQPETDTARQNRLQKNDADNLLGIKLSQSLLKKLKQQAADEGLSLEDFVAELLAESVVLRAWEIVERKNQMRGSSNSHNHNSSSSGQRSGNHQQGRGNRKGHRGMSHGRYQSIMDDKATFLEYVRNQERSRR